MNGISSSRVDDSDNITAQAWVSLFTTLQDSNLDLVKLNLSCNSIDDDGLQLLVRLVSRMSSLEQLDLSSNSSVTHTCWQDLSGYLQSTSFALEELRLDGNNINDDTLAVLTSALANNKTLKRLELFCSFSGMERVSITARGFSAVSTLLCNQTRIIDTYNSNHTLEELGLHKYHYEKMNLPHLSSSLELNKNKDKSEVARQKILQTHFSNDTSNMQEFLDMELQVMPPVITWIGRPTPIDWKGMKVSGLSTMFNLLRRLPDLFNSNAQKKSGGSKRKRDS